MILKADRELNGGEGRAEMAYRAERVCEGNCHLIASRLMDCTDSKAEENGVRERKKGERSEGKGS